MPRTLHTYTVIPSLPERLAPLKELAYNLRWSWNFPTRELFRAIDETLLESSGHNPAKLLGLTDQERFEELASHPAFLGQLDEVYADFQKYMADETWWSRNYGGEFPASFRIAY